MSPLPSRPSLLCRACFCGCLLQPLCRRHLFALLCSAACVFAAIFFGFAAIFCDLCVAAAFLVSLDLSHAFLRLSRAIFVSMPPSCPSSPCCLRFCGYLLRFVSRFPFCCMCFCGYLLRCCSYHRRRLSCLSSICHMRFCGYLLRSLCRCRLLALPRSVAMLFTATSATCVSVPLSTSDLPALHPCPLFAWRVSEHPPLLGLFLSFAVLWAAYVSFLRAC